MTAGRGQNRCLFFLYSVYSSYTPPEMAVRLSKATGTTSESWLLQQVQYDLWHAEQQRKHMDVEKLKAA